MLYWLFQWLLEDRPYAYKSPLFRAALAVLVAFGVVWWMGPWVIRLLTRLKIGDRPEFDHATLNQLNHGKTDTPTMGGVLIVAAIAVSALLLADLSNFYLVLGLFCLVWLAALGGFDDWLKLTAARRVGTRDGLKKWEKLVFQTALGVLLAIFVFRSGDVTSQLDRWTDLEAAYSPYWNVLSIPFYKGEPLADGFWGVRLPLWLFALITVLVVAGTSNAVNLTDGMDGLASGCVVMTAGAFLVLSHVVGDPELSRGLLLFHISGAGELAVLCGAIVGSCLGFLWYNGYPARVFMGDTGSLPLGGLIGYVAIVTRQELMLLIIGGVFVIEALSVLIQVTTFRLMNGKRFFRCTPIHHHFHLGGWTETQVVMRFWLLGALFAAFGLATLKLR
ncbi:MAG: phospho-N-acetylmuramoyl-pentapeptide-transferase [Planctomycetia bacterium]|nr:MAG: phospho-N-acetylmuramoyl-pentapeptide-transferase [Planctomycetia bacterium]